MLTRCPHCQTAFRVSPEQLMPRQGKVRCGACYLVFDALESLCDEPSLIAEATEADAGGTPEAPFQAAPEPEIALEPVQIDAARPADAREENLPPSTPWPFPTPVELAVEVAEVEITELETAEVETEAAHQPAAAPGPAAEQLTPTAEAETSPTAAPELEEPESGESPPEPPPSRRWPGLLWALGSFLLLSLAAGQLIHHYRVELAVLAPALRPPLLAACDIIGCTLPYPRRPELVGIDTSDLTPEAGQDGEYLHLTATLQNRAPFTQEYPHLELTLTDTQDAPLLRKVLAPEDYLAALPEGKKGQDGPEGQAQSPQSPRSPVQGFAARDELSLSLWLKAAGNEPAGYRLYLFYP